ncbi:hypothetical protein D3C74_178910 [compost metagenome]
MELFAQRLSGIEEIQSFPSFRFWYNSSRLFAIGYLPETPMMAMSSVSLLRSLAEMTLSPVVDASSPAGELYAKPPMFFSIFS